MEFNKETKEMFDVGRIILVVGYTIFALMHVIITFLLGWDKWVLLLIAVAVSCCWILHIQSLFTDIQRLWIIAMIMMCNYLIYGIHSTSTYDLAIVMAAIMMLFIMTGVKPLLTLCQITYYITMTYDLIEMVYNGVHFGVIDICRITMHYSVITMLAYFLKTIINNWGDVIRSSKEEIDELTESTERLNDFLANVSHEIRTPVNAIIGLSGICIDKEENPEVKKDMEEVRKAGHRVSDQIGDILDFSEIDRGNIVKNSEDFMLSSAVNDIMPDFREMMKPGVELVIDIDPAIPAVMNSDVTKLKKIIKALVSNGLKYTSEGGVFLKLSSELQGYGVNLFIQVSDTGIGMNEEELELIYERFYQSDSGRARVGSGLGLGLSIVSGFVSLLGGFMTINSKPEVGTTVRVSLPMAVVEPSSCMSVSKPGEINLAAYLKFDNISNPVVRDYYNSQSLSITKGLGVEMHRVESIESLKKVVSSTKLTHLLINDNEYVSDREYIESIADNISVVVISEPGFELPKNSKVRISTKPFYAFPMVSILNSGLKSNKEPGDTLRVTDVHALVVDDEPMNLIVAKSILKRYGMEISTATSGQESIDLCRDHRYDIIFMDHMMGNMDGVEAMKKIRSDVKGLNREIPVVALTANAMSSAKQMFLSEGFDGFVSKPIEIEELERTLKRVLPKNSISFVNKEDEEVLEFKASGDDEVLEFDAASDDEVMEFGPDDDEVLEFGPNDGSSSGLNDAEFLKNELAKIEVDMDTALTFLGGDPDLYHDVLLQFASEMDGKVTKLSNFFEDKNWKEYEIIIHAMKSSSKMIGARPDITEDALKLEKAAHDEDASYIEENHARVLEIFKSLGEKILCLVD
ncbi:MAG: response regulator [Eubacterium sp.]|nr:response regulator [Eubacterium sp.]